MEGDAGTKTKQIVGPNVSSSTNPRVRSDGVAFPEGTPWWAKLGLQFISMVGIPAAICGFLLWERSTVLKEFSNSNQALIRVVERMAPVLERLERKITP